MSFKNIFILCYFLVLLLFVKANLNYEWPYDPEDDEFFFSKNVKFHKIHGIPQFYPTTKNEPVSGPFPIKEDVQNSLEPISSKFNPAQNDKTSNPRTKPITDQKSPNNMVEKIINEMLKKKKTMDQEELLDMLHRISKVVGRLPSGVPLYEVPDYDEEISDNSNLGSNFIKEMGDMKLGINVAKVFKNNVSFNYFPSDSHSTFLSASEGSV